jgi:meso-butanediol dehydrogenase / (S,S)-butanediol dehydrogenase / diacetyl reductase
MRLDDKIAIITGAGSGIGRETAILFAQEGATIIVADRDRSAAERTTQAISKNAGCAEAAVINVAIAQDVKSMIEGVATRYGRLDILVNNAGYGFTGTVLDTTEEQWDAIMAVNVKGVLFGCKYAIPIMERQGGGTIVNTSSGVAQVGITNRAAYCASKGAVAALTRAMALDHVHANIRINCVAPGTIESSYYNEIFKNSEDPKALRRSLEARQPMNRLGKPIEIARAILFLASEDSSFCTGSSLFADGGWTAR